ncbi:MAG: 5-(carboxyamino)imidazole ribonucleotide mutase [Firmicutes bacterium]|nr:5-(carboxyamino)imidazole ribonucleotide mutase [Bacillota bacterium]
MTPIRVGIVLGSDSDLPAVADAEAVLQELGVGYERRILSAHRTPDAVAEYSRGARARGLVAIIAAAGGAAALPGAIAAHTTLPVIGLPVAGPLLGIDALLAMVQMPGGVPVAAVGIGGGRNAGLMAAQIAALTDAELAERLARARELQAARVLEKDARLRLG